MTVRSLGPLWALLILVAVVVGRPIAGLPLVRLRHGPNRSASAAVVVLAVTLASVAWIVSTGSL